MDSTLKLSLLFNHPLGIWSQVGQEEFTKIKIKLPSPQTWVRPDSNMEYSILLFHNNMEKGKWWDSTFVYTLIKCFTKVDSLRIHILRRMKRALGLKFRTTDSSELQWVDAPKAHIRKEKSGTYVQCSDFWKECPRDWFLSCLNLSTDKKGIRGWGLLRTKAINRFGLSAESAVQQTPRRDPG